MNEVSVCNVNDPMPTGQGALVVYPPRWDLPRNLRGWMPLESTSQVPSQSAARFAIHAAQYLPRPKVLIKFFLGRSAPAPEVWEFPPRPLSSPLHFLLVWRLYSVGVDRGIATPLHRP